MGTQMQRHHDEPAAPPLHPGTPSVQAGELRIQLRTPNPALADTHITPAPSKRSESAIVLRSPVLSSIHNSNIKHWEAEVLKRQAEYSARISDLEGRLALFHARLATEAAERGREHAFTVEECVVGPIEEAATRSLQKVDADFVRPIMDPKRAGGAGVGEPSAPADVSEQSNEDPDGKGTVANATTTQLPNLVHLERRTNLLEAQMNHQQHVVLFQARRQHFDAVDRTCRKVLQPELALELTKADKREGKLARRFEASSGEYTRLASEMTSSRVASLGYLEKQMHEVGIFSAEHFLEEIRKLKQLVIEEREERIRQDETVVARIVEKRKTLEQDIFEAC
ncbi:hypothetical protein ACHAXT_011171 [Thalassiosira profunda]